MSPQQNPSPEQPERSGREFTTIDDAIQSARELLDRLITLAESKHPLAVRRGIGREVSTMTDENKYSKTVKAGAKTYFLDVKESREGKPYLAITESRFKGEGEERERATIVIFPEAVEDFSTAFTEMVAKLSK